MGLKDAIKTGTTVVKEIVKTERNGTGPEVKPKTSTKKTK